MPKSDEQMMLIDLPATPVAPAPASAKPPKRRSATTRSNDATSTDLSMPLPDEVPGIVLVDPRFVRVDPVNARFGVAFDPQAQAELIDSMRIAGNTVPVRLRRDPEGGGEYLCPSGSQRLGAALHIQRDQPGFRLRAIVAETMDDREAFVIGEADNAGRTDVAPMQQARQWARALDGIYGGDRQAFIVATGRSASVVSRTLALAALPEYVLACCSDVEALTPYFAEQLAPRLADPQAGADVRHRAEAMIAARGRLPGAKLIRALLDDGSATSNAPQTIWRSADGARSVRYRVAVKHCRIEIPSEAALSAADRRAIIKALSALLAEIGPASTAS